MSKGSSYIAGEIARPIGAMPVTARRSDVPWRMASGADAVATHGDAVAHIVTTRPDPSLTAVRESPAPA